LMLSLANKLNDSSDIWDAYPGFWGSFSLVGEGASR
jgi:hypothetical protein